MAIGMTYEQYWYGDPLMVRAFYKAEKLRQQRMNDEAWLNGAYVYRALDATVGNMFRKNGAKPSEYPQEPIQLSGAEKSESVKQKEAELERLRLVAYLNQVRDQKKKES